MRLWRRCRGTLYPALTMHHFVFTVQKPQDQFHCLSIALRAVFALCGSPAVHEFNQDMTPFGGYHTFHVNPPPIASKTYYHRAPSTIFTPGRSLGSDPYPGGSNVSTVTHPSEMQELCSPRGTLGCLGRPPHGLQLVMVCQSTPFRITRLVWNAA